MRERPDSFSELIEHVSAFRDERDWAQFHTLKNLAAAISIEAAELQEIFLWTPDGDEEALRPLRPRMAEELADVLIHCANFASAAGIDIAQALAVKLESNATRYPIDEARGSAAKAEH